jgi:hypothetical protein
MTRISYRYGDSEAAADFLIFLNGRVEAFAFDLSRDVALPDSVELDLVEFVIAKVTVARAGSHQK